MTLKLSDGAATAWQLQSRERGNKEITLPIIFSGERSHHVAARAHPEIIKQKKKKKKKEEKKQKAQRNTRGFTFVLSLSYP